MKDSIQCVAIIIENETVVKTIPKFEGVINHALQLLEITQEIV
jgi:hypothetical protein